MDTSIAALLAPSDSTGPQDVPPFQLALRQDPQGKMLAVGDEIVVHARTGEERSVALPPLRQLFKGTASAPDLSRGPTPKLTPFFLLLESTVLRFCEADGRDESDQELERIYAQLRRRPDSVDCALHSYLRAAARLYLSVSDVSQAEYEAVMGRLAKSARTFSMAPISRNYVATLRETIGAMGA